MIDKDYKVAFIDESGNFGFNFENAGTSSHFVVTAIIVDADKIELLTEQVDALRRNHFGNGEMKSSNLGKDPTKKRLKILQELTAIEFYVHSYVVDKRKIYPDSGLTYKQTFHKYINSLLHRELKRHYAALQIYSDEHGSEEYMRSFEDYFKEKEYYLLNTYEFNFCDSRDSVLIQLADFISGTIAINYEESSDKTKSKVFMNFLRDKILTISEFPINYKNYTVDTFNLKNEKFDAELALLCTKLAGEFIEKYRDSDSDERVDQVCVLEYLLFYLQTDKPNTFVYSGHLRNMILKGSGRTYGNQNFMTKIIGALRDEGVIISSSSKGYKLPLNIEEVYSYTNHTMQIIQPMLSRMRKCRKRILVATNNQLDIMDKPEYKDIKDYFDYIKHDRI